MAEENVPIKADSDGTEVLAVAMQELLNQYPGFAVGESITYEELEETSGIAFFADAGAVVMQEKVSITDHVRQKCQYPINIIYRTISTKERQKLRAQTLLDGIGKWICQEPVTIDGTTYQLKELPKLAGGRKIQSISRYNSYGAVPDSSGTQDWVLPVKIEYTNEFDRW